MITETKSSKEKELGELAARWRAALAANSSGHMLISQDVRRLGENWADYQEAAGKLDCTTWIKKCVARNWSLARFSALAHIIDRAGDLAKRLDSRAAVWVAGKIADEVSLRRCVNMLVMDAKANNSGTPLTIAMAQVVLRKEISRVKGPQKKCARCEQIMAWAKENGLKLPD